MAYMKYSFDNTFQAGAFSVSIDTKEQYGYFEHDEFGDDCGGGLWFDLLPSGKLEICDYDGVYCLPNDVINGLEQQGYIIGFDFKN